MSNNQRDKAFQIFPYPCIGQMRFLTCHLARLPFYPRVLARLTLTDHAGFLDAGCCVGQELRHLVHCAKIPASNLYGFDLETGFFDLGYELFRDDATKFQATLIPADLDVEDPEWEVSPLVKTVVGKIDVVWAGSLLHFWNYEGQLQGLLRLINLCSKDEGVMVCGRQMGSVLAGEYEMTGLLDKKTYRHNVDSLKGLWLDVQQRTQSCWQVEAALEVGETTTNMQGMSFVDSNARIIWWCATRLS
jgi:SAM-dependent methyltransferase